MTEAYRTQLNILFRHDREVSDQHANVEGCVTCQARGVDLKFDEHTDPTLVGHPDQPLRRRRYTPKFKFAVVAECMVPGVSVASIALRHQLNASLLRRWVKQNQRERAAVDAPPASPNEDKVANGASMFVTLPLPRAVSEACSGANSDGSIRIDVQREAARIRVQWLARNAHGNLHGLAAQSDVVTGIDVLWLCVEPIDMRAGIDTVLARIRQVLGAARPNQGYLFRNSRGTRLKLLVHDGTGIWLAAWCLNQGASTGRCRPADESVQHRVKAQFGLKQSCRKPCSGRPCCSAAMAQTTCKPPKC